MTQTTREIVLRPAREEDLPLLEWGAQYWKYRNIFRRTFADQQIGRRLMLVADLDGEPVGQVFVQFTAGQPHFADGFSRGYLYSLRVKQHLRNQGIGTRLILQAEDELRARGYSAVTIAVGKDNPAAKRLYERLGYTVFTTDPGRWSYVDPDGHTHHIREPAWGLEKVL